MKFPNLFRPIKINNLVLKNRIIATPAGPFDDKSIGGAGVVIAGSSIVDRRRAGFIRWDEPYPFDRYQVEATRKRVIVAKQAGAKACLELIHCGQYARTNDYAIGPTAFVREDGIEVRAMDEAMMGEIADRWAETAASAKELGFDMIMLHFAHGWLATEFLSPLFNKRTDSYGGCLENRARFPAMIIDRVRAAVGKDYPVDMRISAYEWVEGSIEPSDVVGFVKMVQDKIDMVHISSGLDINHEANVHMTATFFDPHMINAGWAAEVKRNVRIPVAVVGSIMTPAEAEGLIASGRADMVALGRPLIADPLWPKKAQEGRDDDIVPCIRCLFCYHISTNRKNVACAVNPRYMKYDLVPLKLQKAEKSRKVVVIGGGPAGMKAALVAEERGHRVALLEKSSALGGALKLADYEDSKVDLRNYRDYLVRHVRAGKIDIKLNTLATPEIVAALDPDALVIAIGAEPAALPIKGAALPHVLQAVDAIPRLDSIGGKVVVIGGGSVGCELALALCARGHDTTVVEIAADFAAQGNMHYRIALRQLMDKAERLTRLNETRCLEITRDGVVASAKGGEPRLLEAETVILATGFRPNRALIESFYGIVPDTYLIGDAEAARNVVDATNAAYFIAANL